MIQYNIQGQLVVCWPSVPKWQTGAYLSHLMAEQQWPAGNASGCPHPVLLMTVGLTMHLPSSLHGAASCPAPDGRGIGMSAWLVAEISLFLESPALP